MKLFILACLLLYSLVGASLLCSALCKPGSCSAADQNSCTDCPNNWSYASGVCSLSAGVGYNLVARSADLSGGSSGLALLPATGSSICGDYTYYAQSTCSSNLEIKMNPGISTPHYAIQVVFWVFLYDDTTWANTNKMNLNLGSQTITRGFDTYDGKLMACDTLMQAYFRMQVDFNHINETNNLIAISVSSDATNSDCKWGLKEAIVLQKPCHASCTQCSGSLNTQCYSCIATNFLSGNTCSIACLTGYGPVTGTKICVLCDSKCITCSENSTYCSSCQTSLPNQSFLHNFSCQVTCPSKTYAKINDHTCASCSSNCLICSNSSVCSSCDTGFGLFNLTCISACPGKYFMDGNICSLCDTKCLLCSGSSTYCSSCVLSGAEQSYLANSSCVVGCPTGTFPTTNPNVCNKCANECSACIGSLASQCSACSSGNFLSNSTCAAACLSLYGSQSSSSVCIVCDLHCTACAELSDNCSACVTAGALETFLDSSNALYKKCTANCPSTTFANAANHLCEGCDTNCLTCGGSATNCFSCKAGDGWLNFVCYTNCPNGYFKDTANCTLCDGLCSSCSNSAVNCSVCSSSGFLLGTSCLTSCPDPYYGLSSICYPCNGACLSCTSSSNSTCSSCNTTFTLSGTICDSNCLPGYGISTMPQQCVLCTSPCTQCYLSDTFCTQCISTPTHYLLAVNATSTCVTACPSTFFYTNHTALACIDCQTGCYICIDNEICITCNSSHLFFNSSCYSPCPLGTFQANSTDCQLCDVYCTSCQFAYDNCTGCQLNGTYRAYLLDYYCYINCPFNYYGASNGKCAACHANCYTCYGSGNNQCTACKANMMLSNTFCGPNCATGYGRVSTNFISCIACNSLCTRCNQIPTNCSSCKAPNGFLYDDGNVTFPKCVLTCPSGTYPNRTTQICENCLVGCSICNNMTLAKSCITCSVGYGLYNGTCHSPCPDKYYLSGVLCLTCSIYCQICNSSNISCSACVRNGGNKAYWFNQTCLKTCPSKYYPIGGGAVPTTCIQCDSPCFNCKDNGTTCTSCPSGLFLFNSTCLSTCPVGYFALNTTGKCEDFTVFLEISMKFSDIHNSKMIIQLDFSRPLDQATFPLSTFQTISFDDPLLSLSIFKVSYQWTSSTSYTIELQPISYIFLNNIKVIVTTMPKPAIVHVAIDTTPFDKSTYSLSANLNWNLIKGTEMSTFQKAMLQTISSATGKIQQFTTLPGIQQFNKAGLGCIIFPGAQLTTASVLIKSIPSPISYSSARFWGSFVLFQIPDWEKDKQKQKYVMSPSASNIADNSRLLSQRNLFLVDQIQWRFKRTGFTTFFLLDSYMQMLLIVASWVLVFIARRLDGKIRASIISKLYSAFHWLHEVSIFYLALGLILQLMYFDSSSTLRLISMVICVIFNLYYLIYELYIYYDLIKYPILQIGTHQYREIAKKYGYFLRHIRYEQYDVTEQWNPSHFFRPYNYHIASFYKKYMMIIAVPLFYSFPHYAAGSLVVLQLFQIIRFSISWPFASKKRNIIRLCLELIILTFFITLVLQVVYIEQISKNNIQTIVSATDIFSFLGWIGFCCIFIFNISFIIFFIHDICCYLTTSNSSEMRSIRKDFYYQKILRYQNCVDEYADNQMLDSWVVKGDLNDHWLEDKQEIDPDIEITVERITITKMGDLFQLQIEKIAVLQMKHMGREVAKQRLKIREQILGTLSIKKQIDSTLFGILKNLFETYDPKYQADYINIKTIAKINPKKYKIGTQIKLSQEPHFQILTLKYPWTQKKVKRLPSPERGFPLSTQLFNSYIYDKMLNKKYLY